jgi:hypothetical protein
MIHDACAAGFRRYDFGEVEEHQEGLAEFKGKWGAKPRQLYRYYFPAPRELQTGVLRFGGAAHQVSSSVWRRLPLKATAFLGRWIYLYL